MSHRKRQSTPPSYNAPQNVPSDPKKVTGESDGSDPQDVAQRPPEGQPDGSVPPQQQDETPGEASTVVLVPTGKHPALTITGSGTLENVGHSPTEDTQRVSIGWMMLPTGVAGLESWCLWLNFLDGMMTAHALAGGRYLELNLLMRLAWSISPFLYGTLKFWMFWVGLKMLERIAQKRDAQAIRVRVLWVVLGLLSLVFIWHLWVLLHLD